MTTKDFILSWGMIFIGIIMNVLGIYIVKLKINELKGFSFISISAVTNYFLILAKSPPVIIGGIILIAAPLPYAIALSKMDLSVVYPLTVAISCILVLFLTVLFLGESISWNKILATTMILISIILLYKP